MATSWNISIGYISGTTYNGDVNTAWETLKQDAKDLADSPYVLLAEYNLYARHIGDDETPTLVYATQYSAKEYNPMTVNDEKQRIFIGASGGNPSRAVKEHMARAFIRVLMRRMHERGIDVNVSVS